MTPDSMRPIGIFDSGIGGLTVARAIVNRMPGENIVYFGDTAHFPYGDKSRDTLVTCSLRATDLLLQKNCKLIVIACNSASTAAFEAVSHHAGGRALVMNVVDPLVQSLALYDKPCRLGLIGTRQTVRSGLYAQKIAAHHPHLVLVSHPTNLLASAIEEFGHHGITDSLIQEYLSHPVFEGIAGLVLACTHYPVVRDKIAAWFGNTTDIIDPSDSIALMAQTLLQQNSLLNPAAGPGTRHFHVSDYTEAFEKGARLFFGHPLHLTAVQ